MHARKCLIKIRFKYFFKINVKRNNKKLRILNKITLNTYE